MEKLSDVLSVAIRQALQDLDACMQDPSYFIDFRNWHIRHPRQFYPKEGAICSVCFAGSVMVKRLIPTEDGTRIKNHLTPLSFPENRYMLFALDAVRSGNVTKALYELFVENSDSEGRLLFDRIILKEAEDVGIEKEWEQAVLKEAEDAGISKLDTHVDQHDYPAFVSKMNEIADNLEKMGY